MTYTISPTIDGDRYKISFIDFMQTIVFTNLTTGVGGEFKAGNGFIVSKKPADFILINEVEDYLAQCFENQGE